MHNQRNFLLFVVLSLALLFGWNAAIEHFYPQPTPAEQAAAAPGNNAATAGRPAGLGDAGAAPAAGAPVPVAAALSGGDRIRIDAPRLAGSVNLRGAVLDDLVLKDHRETVEKGSGPVRLFAPAGTEAQHFAQVGWVGANIAMPGPATLWQADGRVLAPATPVTLRWTSPQGLTFAIRLAIDEHYLITAQQTVANRGGAPVVVQPYGLVNRTSRTATDDIWNVHSGPIGVFGGAAEYGPDYDDLDESRTATGEGAASWLGFTDIYWLSALVPQDGTSPAAGFRALGGETYRADIIYDPQTVAPGRQVTTTTRLFAGAKDSAILESYEQAGIGMLSFSIDWGWFRWFEKPILWLLRALYDFAGNFGVAIILLTLVVRLVMFPIAQKQFASMAAMKAIQPKQKAIQERFKDDRARQQQEIMALYKAEGVNPLAGCLPILIQIPIFFALYKVLILAIEMRHKPFVLWIEDLSAPDPAHILNLFGLLPFTPPGFLAIGVLALLLGITMWLTFRMNPAQMDPIQQQMFAIMPWVMMFLMAPFAAGLLLYWVTSNVLTIAQQAYLYSKHPALKAQKEAARPAESQA